MSKIVSVNVIEYGPGVPKTLREACNRMAHKVASVSHEGGIASASGYGYDIMLRYGYCFDAATHIEIADTVRDAIRALRRISECQCQECVEGLAV